MNEIKNDSSDWARLGSRNTARLRYWTGAWVLTTAVVAFGPRLVWDYATVPTILGVLVNLGVGFGMIIANKKYVQGLDEMQQKIFREAAALTLGVGLVCAISYELLEDIKLIAFEPEISHVIILMCLTFLAAMITSHRKYR
jgi:hypothetical protein